MSQRPDISSFGMHLMLFGTSSSLFFSENSMFVAVSPVVSLVKGCTLESSTFDLPVSMKIN